MPRRALIDFSGGMNTDAVLGENTLYQLHDAYVRRDGEINNRGPIWGHVNYIQDIDASYEAGWTTASWHPNFGMAACRAAGSSLDIDTPDETGTFQIIGAPLQESSPSVSGDLFNNLALETISKEPTPGPYVGGAYTRSSVPTSWQGASAMLNVPRCVQSVNGGAEIIFAGQNDILVRWGGSFLPYYDTGTVSIATTAETASNVVTGSGTLWSEGIEAGQYILIEGLAETDSNDQASNKAYRIVSVLSNTQLVIDTKVWAAGVTGADYFINSLAVVQSNPGSWNTYSERPTTTGICTFYDGKLVVMGVSDNAYDYNTIFDYDTIRWSGTIEERGGVNNNFSGVDLWHEDARISVAPGIGGAGRGLTQMGRELVIIKAHAMFRLENLPAWDKPATTTTLSIIPGAENVGAKGFNAWGKCKHGVVVASSDGLYVYDGTSVKCVTDGRIARWWYQNLSRNELRVGVFEDKVIVSCEPGSTSYSAGEAAATSLVWDLERNVFWTMDTEFVPGPCISTWTENDEFVGQFCLPASAGPVNDDGQGTVYFVSNINGLHGTVSASPDTHKFSNSDMTSFASPTEGSIPLPRVQTSPFPLGDNPLQEGRVNNILVHSLQDTSDDSELTVELTRGNISPDDVVQTPSVQEYGIAPGTEDRVHRIPVDSFGESPAARITLYSDVAGAALYLYGIGVDYEPTNNLGPS